MAYSILAALEDRIGTLLYARLTDRVNGTSANTAVAQQILDEADAEVNTWLAVRYTTPMDLSSHSELQEILEARALDVAEYRAWQGSPFVNDIPTRVKGVYAEALRWLREVRDGAIALPASLSAAAAADENNAPLMSGTPRTFTHEELDGL